jgi:uncharacterized membrane protein YhaH (DUF805 family)
MTLRGKLFSFDGRLRRQDWWVLGIVSSLVYVAVACAVAFATGELDLGSGYFLAATIGDPIEQLLIAASVHAPLVLIYCALAAKRAHDRNHSARLVVPLVLATAAMSYMPDNAFLQLGQMADAGAIWAWPAMIIGILINVSSIYLLVVLGFLDGTPGPNRFGPSPKGLSGGAPAFMAPGGVE